MFHPPKKGEEEEAAARNNETFNNVLCWFFAFIVVERERVRVCVCPLFFLPKETMSSPRVCGRGLWERGQGP